MKSKLEINIEKCGNGFIVDYSCIIPCVSDCGVGFQGKEITTNTKGIKTIIDKALKEYKELGE